MGTVHQKMRAARIEITFDDLGIMLGLAGGIRIVSINRIFDKHVSSFEIKVKGENKLLPLVKEGETIPIIPVQNITHA